MAVWYCEPLKMTPSSDKPCPFKAGDRVRFTRAYRTWMRWARNPSTGRYHQRWHVREFGRCVGVVLGPVDFGTQLGPEVDVRWEPSGLKYGYEPEDLELVR